MKKVIPVLLAAVFALGLSAFTSVKFDDVNYKNSPGGPLIPVDIEPCPENGTDPCVKEIPGLGGQQRQLFHDDGSPYLWDAQTR